MIALLMKINTMIHASFSRLKRTYTYTIGMYKAVLFVKYEWSITSLSHINIYIIYVYVINNS